MDPIKDLLKKSGMSNILISIIFGLFGIILYVFHEGAVKLISCLIGLLFLLIGVARLVNYVKGRGRGEHLNFDLLWTNCNNCGNYSYYLYRCNRSYT